MPLNIITSKSNRVTQDPYQLVDTLNNPSIKGFSLDDNRLDGTYHPVDATGIAEIGWWGDVLSDENGNLPTQEITILQERTVSTMVLDGDSLLDNYPVDFTFRLYKNNVLLHTEVVKDNVRVHWTKTLGNPIDVDKIAITITKINQPKQVVKILEAGSVIPPVFKSGNDNLIMAARHAIIVTNQLQAEDTFKINAQESSSVATVHIKSHDACELHMSFDSHINNIHSLMVAPVRQVFGKVEITYAEPFLNDNVQITSTEVGRGTSVQGIADNVELSEYKWASLHDNVLDDTYHPIPEEQSTIWHVGLWGTSLSDNQGRFTQDPRITVTFDARPVAYFKVAGDNMLNNYPVDFTVKAYGANGQVLRTENVTNNQNVSWYLPLTPQLEGVTKLTLDIHRISQYGQVFKITEFFNSIVETYYNQEIVNIHLLEELNYEDSQVTLGAVSANEIDIVLDNTLGKFDINDLQSPLHNLIKKNRKVRAWLGVRFSEDYFEWHPLGTFWTSQWNIPDRSLTATLTARDRLDTLNYSEFRTSIVYTNISVAELFRKIFTDAGITDSGFYIAPSFENLILPYAWFDIMSHRAALQRLASCLLCNVYCDRLGKIIVEEININKEVFFTYSDKNNVINKDYPFAWNEVTNYVSVVAHNYKQSAQVQLLDTQNPITLKAKESLTISYTYEKTPAFTNEEPVLTGASEIFVESYKSYVWGIELHLKNQADTTKTINSISVRGTILEEGSKSISVAKDDAGILADGLSKTEIDQPLIQNYTYASTLANAVLTNYKASRYDVNLNCRGNIAVYLGQKIQVEDLKYNKTEAYAIKRQTWDWNGAFKANVECRKL